MPVDTLRENDEIVHALQGALSRGEHGLQAVPLLLKRTIIENRWQERFVQAAQRQRAFAEFRGFVTEPLPDGLGATIGALRRLCGDDPEAIDLIDRAVGSRQGERTDLLDNVQEVSPVAPTGNRADRALRRLRKDRKDLHAEVIAGRMSPHAAMVAAGFRPKTYSLRADDPDKAAAVLARHFDAHDIGQICSLALAIREGMGR